MNKERLLVLANFLDTVPTFKFDLTSWRHHPGADHYVQDSDLVDSNLTDMTCGTTACAVGWACSIPEFNAQGLFWEDRPVYEVAGVWGKHRSWGAVTGFFDLGTYDAEHLFTYDLYPFGERGPKDVAARIRTFVKDDGDVN